MNGRALVLASVLTGVLALAFWRAGETAVRAAEPVPVRTPPAQPAAAKPPEPADGPVRAGPRFAKLGGNLFPSQTWRPPPPPPPKVKPLPPPPPEPPAFPFAYFGRWIEAGKDVVFLKRGEKLMRVKAGDVVDGAWRLDQVGKGGLVFTYLPLNMQKTLRIER